MEIIEHYLQHFEECDDLVMWKTLMKYESGRKLPTKCMFPDCAEDQRSWDDLEVHLAVGHSLLNLILKEEQEVDHEEDYVPSEKKEVKESCHFCLRQFSSHLLLDQHMVREWVSLGIRRNKCVHCVDPRSDPCVVPEHESGKCELAPEL